jgi:uncharacterized membrane-anchored protein
VDDRKPDWTRYLFAAFVTAIFLVLAYYLLSEIIPSAVRPTLHPVHAVTSTTTQ